MAVTVIRLIEEKRSDAIALLNAAIRYSAQPELADSARVALSEVASLAELAASELKDEPRQTAAALAWMPRRLKQDVRLSNYVSEMRRSRVSETRFAASSTAARVRNDS